MLTQKSINEQSLWDKSVFPFLRKKGALQKHWKILDLGCGSGRLCIKLTSMGFLYVTGIDKSEENVKLAKTLANKNGLLIEFVVADLTRLKYRDEFDLIICVGVLHHFPSLKEPLQAIYRYLKEGGIFLTIEPNKFSPIRYMKWIHDRKRLPPYEKLISPMKLRRELSRTGFSIVEFRSFNKKRLGPNVLSRTLVGTELLSLSQRRKLER